MPEPTGFAMRSGNRTVTAGVLERDVPRSPTAERQIPGTGARNGHGSRTGCAACREATEKRAVRPAESDGRGEPPPPRGRRSYRKSPIFFILP